MATAVSGPSTFDLKTQSSFPIRLGPSILKPSESKRFTSVRYNHKPRNGAQKDVECNVKPGKASNESLLSLKDSDGEYRYSGKDVSDGYRFILLSRGSGKDKEMVLERLDGAHEFNMIKAPQETDATKLARKYPQLPEDEKPVDDLFGDADPAEEPLDPSNPFDYRNYLKSSSVQSHEKQKDAPQSSANTPLAQPRPASATPHSRPAKRSEGLLVTQKKRKVQEGSKPNPKRVKAGTEPPEPPSATKSEKKTNVPKLRVDRKASVRRASLDDTGELILENETPTSEILPKRQGAMALALAGQLGQGPISLHSAASSPASRIASPMPERPEGMEEGEEFELGELSPETPNKQRHPQRFAAEDDDADEEDGNADADVEDLELPSPVQNHHKNVDSVPDVAADDEDDLDKQLALAMAEPDDGDAGGPPPARPPESDEESEEE